MSRLRLNHVPEWGIHAFVWSLLILKEFAEGYYAPTHPIPKTAVLSYWLIAVGYVSISAGAFYGAVWLVARPLQQTPLAWRHYAGATAGLLGTFVAITTVRYGLEMAVFKPLLGFDNYSRVNDLSAYWFVRNSVFYYFDFALYGLLYAFVARYFANERRRRETEQARTAAELAFLRSQLNPHFLFNTINDIYALVYRKADDAPKALLKLSELLRYVLHDARHDHVPLAKEIDYLHNLIDLQRIGAKDNLHVDYQQRGPLNGQTMAPMLLVSFLENAFKHGVASDPAAPIRLHLDLTETTLDFTLHNQKSHQQTDQMSGIGLANVQRRLTLLYPNRHTLHIADEPDHYHVNLHLDL